MTTPSIGISSILKLYLDLLKYKLCFSAIFKNQIVLSSNSFIVLAGTTKSSIWFSNTPLYNSSWNMLFIILWNVPRELHSPKYMTYGSNNLLFIKKATFYSLPSFICTLLYSQIRLSLFKYLASFSLSITSSINRSGVLSLMVTWLSFL